MTENLKEQDRRCVWHPFTQMKAYRESDPPLIESGDGVFLYDEDGTKYYDGVSSIWLNVHGHGVDEIDDAIKEQLDDVAHATLLGQGNAPAARFAKMIADRTPGSLNHVFFADSGANAVEIGMKMAVQYFANDAGKPTPKQRFLTFEGGYHGDTFGPMSVVPDDTFHWPFTNLLPDPVQVPFPHPYRWKGTSDPETVREKCLKQVQAKINRHENELAGLMVEPVQGAGGMVPPPDGFLQGLESICERHELLLVVDEVATGFGRTGTLFACEQENVEPDVMTLGKGITGGYLPLSAAVARTHVFEQFLGEVEEKKALFHGHSYTGNPLACAAGIASLKKLESEVLDTLPNKAERIQNKLSPVEDQPFIGEFRQSGLMCAAEVVMDKDENTPFPWEEQAGSIVADHAREKGMLLRAIGNFVPFLPPLGTPIDHLDEMITIYKRAVDDAQDELRTIANRHT